MTDKKEENRILVVDDIEENLKVLSETLIEEGFYPLQAKSGERAIQIAKKAKPDLILLDIKMPDMDGFETIARLKGDPETSGIPVIFISALNQIEDKVRGFRAGAVDYVSKPFQKEEVIARVGTHLRLKAALDAVERERGKSDRLLLNILPAPVAHELKETGKSTPQYFPEATILFSDLVNFTEKSRTLGPEPLLAELDAIFSAFDGIMRERGCERIKTIGDAYFAVSGIPTPDPLHARKMLAAARDMVAWLRKRNETASVKWEMRLGMHSGCAIAGIVGTDKYVYDVFGDSVNTAKRLESSSEPMRINVSERTAELLGADAKLEPRGSVEVKGKGLMPMFFVSEGK
ncbi:MAG TPA: adenylate/guanylate cyclase domain-containing protein [Treponemataceae bacterium]|nr:adenylate/guanylate cyclase domain-containing protein [Treponemataceae bacterium]